LTARRGFTLIELMVVIGIIVILLGITVFAVAAMAKDSKQSSAVNAVQSALGKARALAMQRGEPVLIAFLPHVDEDYEHPHIVYAAYSGQSYINDTGTFRQLVDRFIPLTGLETDSLPRGIKVAAPWYAVGDAASDQVWIAASSIVAIANNGEVPGAIVAVMFDADGSVITENARSDSTRIFLDVNNDGMQQYGGAAVDPASFSDTFAQIEEADEVYLSFAPFIAVYDDDEAREFKDPGDWNNGATKDTELTQYIDEFADRLHFNRYTGVVMR
jgi:prepilin-type N-terminal cleavage/methylation domain-containing protein